MRDFLLIGLSMIIGIMLGMQIAAYGLKLAIQKANEEQASRAEESEK